MYQDSKGKEKVDGKILHNYIKNIYTTLLERLPQLTLLPERLRQQRASGVALAAWEKIGRGESGNAASLVPNYLRLSQAERARLEKTKTE